MSKGADFHREILQAYKVATDTDVPLRMIMRTPEGEYAPFEIYIGMTILSGNRKDLDDLTEIYTRISHSGNRDTDAILAGSLGVRFAYRAVRRVMDNFIDSVPEDELEDVRNNFDEIGLGSDFENLVSVQRDMEQLSDVPSFKIEDARFEEIQASDDYLLYRTVYLLKVASIIFKLDEIGIDGVVAEDDELTNSLVVGYVKFDTKESYRELIQTPTYLLDEPSEYDEYGIATEIVAVLSKGGLSKKRLVKMGLSSETAEVVFEGLDFKDIKKVDRERYDYYMSIEYASSVANLLHESSLTQDQLEDPFDVEQYISRMEYLPYRDYLTYVLGIYYSYIDKSVNIVSVSKAFFETSSDSVFIYNDINRLSINIQDWLENEGGVSEVSSSIIQSMSQLSAYTEGTIAISKHTPTNSSTRFYPTFRGSKIDKTDGLEIFDLASTSREVLYIVYVDGEGNERSKLYTGTVEGHSPDYETILNRKKLDKTPHHIYMLVWSKTFRTSIISDIPKASLFVVDIDLIQGSIDVESFYRKDGDTITDTTASVEASLDFLELGKGTTVVSRGSFRIYGWEPPYREESFIELSLTDPIFSLWVTVPEDQHTVAIKGSKQLSFVYASPFGGDRKGSGVKINAKKRITSEAMVDRVYTSKKSTSSKYKVDEETRYLLCTYTTNSSTSIESLLKSLPSVLEYYMDIEEPANDKYIRMHEAAGITEQETKWISDVQRGVRERYDNERLTSLMEADNRLFSVDYASVCPNARQPVKVPKKDLKKWKKTKIAGKKADINRTVIRMGGNYYGCDTSDFPYIGVRTNNTSTSSAYGYAPCCFPKPQNGEVVDGTPVKSQLVSDYENGVDPQDSKNKGESLTVDRYSLKEDTYAKVPGDLSLLLEDYKVEFEPPKEGRGRRETISLDVPARIGVPRSPSSIIHSILKSGVPTDSKAYADGVREIVETEGDMEDEEAKSKMGVYSYDNSSIQREEYVERVRAKMAESTHPNLLAQEMYNYNPEDRIKLLGDPLVYLDPKLFINAIEEYFNLNIYCFVQGTEKGGTDSGSLAIPYHEHFYCKPYRPTRRVLLIMMVKISAKSESFNNEYQCEPIVMAYKKSGRHLWDLSESMDSDSEVGRRSMFNEEMSYIWETSYETLTWGRTVESNIYSGPAVADRLPGKMFSQKIDSKGKAYSFEMRHRKVRYTVITDPTRPYNKPTTLGDSPRCTHKKCIELFGKPTCHSLRNGKVDGYWYPVSGRVRGFYVPLTDGRTMGTEAYDPPIVEKGESNVMKWYRFGRSILFIRELITYMYYFVRLDGHLSFWQNKVITYQGDYTGDGLDFYRFEEVGRNLPEANTLEDTMLNVYNMKTGLVDKVDGEYMVIAYSEKFRGKLKYLLKEIALSVQAEQDARPKHIRGYYSQSTDYIQRPNETVFHTADELTNWKLSSIVKTKEEGLTYEHSKITWDLSDRVTPYVYRKDKTYFLVQNVFHTVQAEYVALVWREQGYNPGYFTEGYTDEKPDVYCIDSTGELVLVSKSKKARPLSVLYYGSPMSYREGIEKNQAALLCLTCRDAK